MGDQGGLGLVEDQGLMGDQGGLGLVEDQGLMGDQVDPCCIVY